MRIHQVRWILFNSLPPQEHRVHFIRVTRGLQRAEHSEKEGPRKNPPGGGFRGVLAERAGFEPAEGY